MSSSSYYQEGSERAHQVQHLFTKIARYYDLINDLQSAGMHRVWKRRLISALQVSPQDRVLDLACGSGDLAFRLLKAQPRVRAVGGDFTRAMLKVAQSRAQQSNSRDGPVQGWVNLDGLNLPFAENVFDAVMMAYGLRNMADPLRALKEIARILKVGGRLAILDFGRPRNPVIRVSYHSFLRTIQPAIGWLFFQDSGTYRYIYESLMRYPAQEGVTRMLEETGFQQIACHHLALGTMSLHAARKTS